LGHFWVLIKKKSFQKQIAGSGASSTKYGKNIQVHQGLINLHTEFCCVLHGRPTIDYKFTSIFGLGGFSSVCCGWCLAGFEDDGDFIIEK
jgi:hypothetical protein